MIARTMIQRRRSTIALLCSLLFLGGAPMPGTGAEKRVKSPTMEDVGDGTRRVLLPEDIKTFLNQEFPNSRLPAEADFSAEMRQYYYSRLLGVFPAVAYGDFNGDKKKDYMFLLITGESKWGPLCELVAVNGQKKTFEAFRLGEVYSFKDDYVSFQDGKLLKGRYKKGAWYINWDAKKKIYVVTKS